MSSHRIVYRTSSSHYALTIVITHHHRIDTSHHIAYRIIIRSSHRITSSHLLSFIIIVYCVSHCVSHRIVTHHRIALTNDYRIITSSLSLRIAYRIIVNH
jgi:hypothetical protein